MPNGYTKIPNDPDRLIGLPRIAAECGISPPTLRQMALMGTNGIPVRRVGGRWWASRAALTAWVEVQTASEWEEVRLLDPAHERMVQAMFEDAAPGDGADDLAALDADVGAFEYRRWIDGFRNLGFVDGGFMLGVLRGVVGQLAVEHGPARAKVLIAEAVRAARLSEGADTDLADAQPAGSA